MPDVTNHESAESAIFKALWNQSRKALERLELLRGCLSSFRMNLNKEENMLKNIWSRITRLPTLGQYIYMKSYINKKHSLYLYGIRTI
jgi:hypothetical protein